jgi:hypothetical protein
MTIRVLLDTSTRMARSALQAALVDCEDIELVDTGPAAIRGRVDVVVLQEIMLDQFPRALQAIADASRIGVVAIDEAGEAGDLYRVYHSCWRSASNGANSLADAIRSVASAS